MFLPASSWLSLPLTKPSLEAHQAELQPLPPKRRSVVLLHSVKLLPHLPSLSPQVIETVEPPHAVVDDSHGDLELYASAVADYTKYECPVREIKFRETLMYQTRVYRYTHTRNNQYNCHKKFVASYKARVVEMSIKNLHDS